jgi:hypothetical protein
MSGRTAFLYHGVFSVTGEEQLELKHGLNSVFSNMSWKNSLLSNTVFQTSKENFVLLCRRLQTSQILISKISYLCAQLSS